jgi:hypothetical protein
MTTPEQIQAWALATPLKEEFWLHPTHAYWGREIAMLTQFAELARADLVAENGALLRANLDCVTHFDALMADYNNVSTENEELRTKMLAMACAQVDREDALKAELETLRNEATAWHVSYDNLKADADRYRHAKLYNLLGGFTDKAIDRDICIHNAAMKGTPE